MRYVIAAGLCLCLCADLERNCFCVSDFQPQVVNPAEIQEDAQSIGEAELAAMLIRAKFHASSEDVKKAEEIYRAAIEKFPQSGYAHFQLASLLMGTDEIDSRIQHLEKAIELDPKLKQAYESLGRAYMIKQESEKAIATYVKAVENVEDSISFYGDLAHAYIAAKRMKEAEDTLLEACKRHPRSSEAWLKLIEFYASNRETQKEEETFEKALKETRNSQRLLRDVRLLYHGSKEDEKALRVLVRTLELYPESAQMWVQLVRRYLAVGDKEKAREATQKAIGHVRYDEDFFSLVAVAYMNALDWDSAIAVLTEGTKYHEGSLEMWRTLAGLYEQKGQREQARECYRKILSMEPTRIHERKLLARSFVADKNYQEAIEEFLKAIRVSPGDIRLRAEAASTYFASGQFEEGEKIHLDLIKERPGNSDMYLLLANYYYMGNKPDKMQETIEAAARLEKDPARQARVYSLMGQAALEKEDIPTALKLLDEAAKQDPGNPAHAYALSRAYLLAADKQKAEGKKDEAAETFGKAIALLQQNCEKDPKNWVAWYQLGQAYETADNDQLASEAYAESVKLQPENGDLRYKLATVYSGLRQHQKTQEQLEKAIKLPAAKPEWFLLLGEVYRTVTKKNEAEEAFERAITVLGEERAKNPQNFQVQAALAEAYSAARRYTEAADALRKAIELAGEKADFRLHVALARALEASGRRDDARADYLKAAALLEKAAADNPSDDEIYLRMGLVYQSVPDYAKSSEALAKGIELAGGGATHSSIIALAQSLDRLGKVEAAREQYEKAYSLLTERLKEQPKDLSAHYMLANVCDKLDKLDECEREYKTAMELDPFFAAAYNNLGYTWIERDQNLDEAIKLVQKALELDGENGAYIDSLGWAYFRQGKFDEALSELQRALKLENTDPTIYDHIGDVYKAKSMIKEAIEYWQKALEINPHDQKIKGKIEENRKNLPPAEKDSQPESPR